MIFNKKKKKKDGLFFYVAFMIIPVVQFIIFYIGVNANTFILAFQKYDRWTGTFSFVAFDNFKQIFKEMSGVNGIIGISLKNSLYVYLVSTFVELPLTLFFSYYIFKKKLLSGLYRVLLFLPSIISTVVLVSLYKILVESGYVQLMGKLGKTVMGLLTLSETQFPTLLFYHVMVSFGTTLLVYSSSMFQISTDTIEAAALDGVNQTQELFKIIIPQIWPTVATFLTVGIVAIFTDQANLYTFYRDKAEPTNYTVGYYLFIKVMGDNSSLADYPQASAMGLLFSFIAIPITFFMKWLFNLIDPNEN